MTLRQIAFAGVLALVFWRLGGDVQAQKISLEVLGGSAYNIPSVLTVRQTGYPDIRFTAHYDTKPFGPYSPYYSWRVDFWNRDHDAAWELTQVHHRIFLANNPPDIQFFAIHFGYNFFLAGRAWKRHGFVYHVDGGVLICNPANTVRGQTLNTHNTGIFDAGYKLSGVGAEAAVSRDLYVTKHVFVVVNGAFMVGRARVPVVNGSADVPNFGLHGQIGAGFSF